MFASIDGSTPHQEEHLSQSDDNPEPQKPTLIESSHHSQTILQVTDPVVDVEKEVESYLTSVTIDDGPLAPKNERHASSKLSST